MGAARSIPTITNSAEQQNYLKNYQQALQAGINSAITPIAPYNFSVTSMRGGAMLKWSPLVNLKTPTSLPPKQSGVLPAADGYEIQKSTTGDFSPGNYTSIPLRDPTQSSFFDAVGGGPQTFTYRIRATNGTGNNPYSVHGLVTAPVPVTTIDSSDKVTGPATSYDVSTSQQTQNRAKNWPSGVNSPFQ